VTGVIIGIGYLVLYVLWTIRRLHDFNVNGWFTFIFILPLINLVLWLIPGTRGENNYGPMQPPNTLGVISSALVTPLVFIVLAAIAIPAYQDFTIRARVAEGVNFANPARTALSTACQKGNLASKTDNALLGLASPTAYGETSKVVKSIAAAGLSDTSGQVTITFRAVGFAPEGAQIVYRGECGSSGMTWTVTTGGGFPPKYQPRT
jgi:type IV pilus assembly protein PilA